MKASRPDVEAKFSAYEMRPVPYSREEIAERMRGAFLGRELNRLQGYEGGPVADRVQALYARGQINKEELIQLTLECSELRLLEGRSVEHDR